MTSATAPVDSVSVCIDRGFSMPHLQLARILAGRIFAEIGTGIEWRCSSGSEQPITITISTHPPYLGDPDALAYAQPYGGGIRVFYGRIDNYAPETRGHLLAHVLAHEITHVLQGMMHHSDSGIMKAHWDYLDLRKMRSRSLEFTPDDILLIHRGIASLPLRRLDPATRQRAQQSFRTGR